MSSGSSDSDSDSEMQTEVEDSDGERSTEVPSDVDSSGSQTRKLHPDFTFDDGDLLLRSSDGTTYRVHKLIISNASEWFRGMFTLPQGGISPPSLEPIDLAEDSKTVSFLLSSIYPSSTFPAIKSYKNIWGIVAAAQKYEMQRVLDLLKPLVLSKPQLCKQSLSLYALACKCQWKDVMRDASHGTLEHPLASPSQNSKEETWRTLKRLSSADLCQLMRLHEERKSHIINSFKTLESITSFQLTGINIVASEEEGEGEDERAHLWHCTDCGEYTWNSYNEGWRSRKVRKQFKKFQRKVREYVHGNPMASGLVNGEAAVLQYLAGPLYRRLCEGCNRRLVNGDVVKQSISNAQLPDSVFDV